MTQLIQRTIGLFLTLALLLGLGACGAPAETEDAAEAAPTAAAADETPAVETEAEPAQTPEPPDQLQLAEREITGRIDYGATNFLTERDFYDALEAMLALQGLTLTPVTDGSAYFCFDYGNIQSVKLLTVSKTMEEIMADRARAQEVYDAKAAAHAAGEDYEEEETETSYAFDPDKDVRNSEDYVIAFVLSAADSEVDQQVMFLVASAVWSILNPNYDNSKDSFSFLKNALFGMYKSHGGAAVSTIDGIDNDYSFTIPGNAVEGWLGTDSAGNFILDITLYAVYDEIIDIAASGGSSLETDAYSSVLGDVYG